MKPSSRRRAWVLGGLFARRPGLAFGLAAGVLAVFVLAMHVVRLPEPLGVDQGLFACFARWVPRGWLPYRDLFDCKPPLFLYWWAVSGILPGDVVRAAWWWEGAWLGATLAVAFTLGCRLGGRWTGLIAAALLFVALWSPAWADQRDPFAARAQAEEVLALPMLASAWLAMEALDRKRLALWAGVLVGACGLVKLPSMAIAVAWSVGWIACVAAREAARRIGLMAAGIAVPWALAFAWFAAHGATSSFVDGVFVYPRYIAAFIAPPWTGVAQQYASTMVTRAPLLVVAAVIGIVRLSRSGRREVHWAAAWIVATMMAVVLQRELAGHQYLLVAPALAVVGAIGIVDTARALRDPSSRILAFAALGGLAIFAFNEGVAWWRAYAPDVAVALGRTSRDEYLRAIQLGGLSLADEEAAASWVREHTAPRDGVLIWAHSPGVYALADRHPVTRFPDKLLLTDAPMSRMWPGLDQRREGLLERIRRDPPAIVLVGQGDANRLEPLDSFTSLTRFRDLRMMVQREYEAAPGLGGFLVLRLRTSADSTAPPI